MQPLQQETPTAKHLEDNSLYSLQVGEQVKLVNLNGSASQDKSIEAINLISQNLSTLGLSSRCNRARSWGTRTVTP